MFQAYGNNNLQANVILLPYDVIWGGKKSFEKPTTTETSRILLHKYIRTRS